jgi:hypothetical protein
MSDLPVNHVEEKMITCSHINGQLPGVGDRARTTFLRSDACRCRETHSKHYKSNEYPFHHPSSDVSFSRDQRRAATIGSRVVMTTRVRRSRTPDLDAPIVGRTFILGGTSLVSRLIRLAAIKIRKSPRARSEAPFGSQRNG